MEARKVSLLKTEVTKITFISVCEREEKRMLKKKTKKNKPKPNTCKTKITEGVLSVFTEMHFSFPGGIQVLS